MPKLTPQLRDEIITISDPVIRERWQKYFSIPVDLQNMLFDQMFADKIGEIVKERYQLGYENMTRVAKIIGLIFLGELAIKDFITALKNELNVDAETAKAIAQDINLAIFQPVRESLMAVHGIAATPQSAASQPPQSLPADKTIDAPQISNSQFLISKQAPNPNNQILNESQADFEAQRQKEKLITKLKNQNNGNIKDNAPYQARPASYRVSLKNIVDLRKMKSKKKHNGFFS